jgi:ribonuclease HII
VSRSPGRSIERRLWEAGHDVIVGVDEVGRGSWAGPLVVGAAVIPPERRIVGVRDSKQLSENRREAIFDNVARWCRAWAVGWATQRECDELGMSAAQKLAARRAVDGLALRPDAVLVDGPWDFVGLGVHTERLVKGDARCTSIAAASILAKVSRDRWMRSVASHYPAYGFESNKGYPCPVHRAALQWLGPSAIHRRSWVFMESLMWTGVRRVPPVSQQLTLDVTSGDGSAQSPAQDPTAVHT